MLNVGGQDMVRKDQLTAIDIRHIEHSDEWVDAVSEPVLVSDLPRARNLLCVVRLDFALVLVETS